MVESSVSRDVMAMQYPSIFKLRLGKWLSVDTWLFPTFLSDRGRLVNGSVGLVQERIAGKESMDRKDIMSYLLAAKDPETGESLSIDEVRTEAFLMLGAGKHRSAILNRFCIDDELFLVSRRRHNLHSDFCHHVLPFAQPRSARNSDPRTSECLPKPRLYSSRTCIELMYLSSFVSRRGHASFPASTRYDLPSSLRSLVSLKATSKTGHSFLSRSATTQN